MTSVGGNDFQKALPGLLPELMASPRLFLHQLDRRKNAALIIDADRAFYKDAIFLDQRALKPDARGAWVPLDVIWQHLDDGLDHETTAANFIFHTGHCGSTLISRLLDEIPTVFGLREPLVLRTMATELQSGNPDQARHPNHAFERLYWLLVRRFSRDQQVIIKPTSICNNLASHLLSQHPANHGILLYVKLEVYLANMLDKENNDDIDGFLSHRQIILRNIVPDLDLNLAALTRSQKVAFSWLAEAVQLQRLVAGDLKTRVLLLDFDAVLKDKETYLAMILRQLDIPFHPESINRILSSPVLDSYSKLPGFKYSQGNRQAIIRASRINNAAAIKEGMKFVEKLFTKHPALEAVSKNIALA